MAEYGRQPWSIAGVLPTFLASSSISAAQVWFSLTGFVLFYTALAVVEVYLMVRTVRLGPGIVSETGAQPEFASPPGALPQSAE